MWCLELLAKDLMPVFEGYRSSLDMNLLQGGATYGKTIQKSHYSESLQTLMLGCLLEDPRKRPSPKYLVKHISEVIDTISYMAEDDSWDFETDLGPGALPIAP